jgi:integrase
LMTIMKRANLSDSTIQKEIALLRHAFNMAIQEWGWKTFENPASGLQLGKSKIRFVVLTQDNREKLMDALSACDNPYFKALVVIALYTALRLSSLLDLKWSKINLEQRTASTTSKTGEVHVALSLRVVDALAALPRDPLDDRVFPMTQNAVRLAWKGVREKVGLLDLQFRDLRHVAAIDYAKKGFNSHELKIILCHSTTKMAEVYVNIAGTHITDKMDATDPYVSILDIPAATESGKTIMNRKRLQRLLKRRLKKAKSEPETD